MAHRKRATTEEIEVFRQLIRAMSRDSLLYSMLQDELGALGHWKQKPRGKPDERFFKGKQTEFID